MILWVNVFLPSVIWIIIFKQVIKVRLFEAKNV